MDGEHVEIDGVTCLVDIVRNFGGSDFEANINISISDGLLDEMLIREWNIRLVVAAGIGNQEIYPSSDSDSHLQDGKIRIRIHSNY
jgi:hypothetical protein